MIRKVTKEQKTKFSSIEKKSLPTLTVNLFDILGKIQLQENRFGQPLLNHFQSCP